MGVSGFNSIVKPLLAVGVPIGPNGLLTTTGRTSGLPRTTPIAIIEDGGRKWIWSPWGDVHWVRNLRATDQATIAVRGRSDAVRAVELDPAGRVAFFRDTFAPVARRMRFGARFVRMLDGVDIDDPAAAAKGHPVFELVPMDSPVPATRRGQSNHSDEAPASGSAAAGSQ
jgi:deazaflavin-dependent oxidoreductase (nitroreductase family)